MPRQQWALRTLGLLPPDPATLDHTVYLKPLGEEMLLQ